MENVHAVGTGKKKKQCPFLDQPWYLIPVNMDCHKSFSHSCPQPPVHTPNLSLHNCDYGFVITLHRWNPDAIVFNSWQQYGTPSYWVQHFFKESSGATLHPTTIQANASNSLVASAITCLSSVDNSEYLKIKVSLKLAWFPHKILVNISRSFFPILMNISNELSRIGQYIAVIIIFIFFLCLQAISVDHLWF